ncbi:hypothetical protein QGN29_06915 [Temperatibacter marinus]|uniref:Lipoprotein n=1 Tax=Temperatibacter marinus TaxID=1456591 RepID=A0AA52HBX4_9PROT|nr:hypothetical protein [Temperatibacter marinus]WND04103.1 hypothetical protein QGN29_06915 [Temperatibacter marinus]
MQNFVKPIVITGLILTLCGCVGYQHEWPKLTDPLPKNVEMSASSIEIKGHPSPIRESVESLSAVSLTTETIEKQVPALTMALKEAQSTLMAALAFYEKEQPEEAKEVAWGSLQIAYTRLSQQFSKLEDLIRAVERGNKSEMSSLLKMLLKQHETTLASMKLVSPFVLRKN